jgi:iron complex outermembrane recepter protein
MGSAAGCVIHFLDVQHKSVTGEHSMQDFTLQPIQDAGSSPVRRRVAASEAISPSAAGKRPAKKHSALAAAHLLCTVALPVAAATDNGIKHFDIERQSLASALHEFAPQSDRQILFSTDVTDSKQTPGVKGNLAPEAALKVLLRNTGLTFRTTADNTILIEHSRPGDAAASFGSYTSRNGDPQHRGSTTVRFMRVAQVDERNPSAGANQSSAPGSTGVAAGAADGGTTGLEEVVVTAQRRVERLQDVPIAISAIGSEALAARGVSDLSSLNGAVPGLNITGFAAANASNLVSLRGVAGQPLPIGAGQATAIYLDGVYLARPEAAFFALDDVERIEVLRGPQGTLYGRNATAGAINIITREPGDQPAGGVDVSYGNYNAFAARGSFSGPLGGGFAGGLSGSYEERDGYFTDTLTMTEPDARDAFTVRGKLRYASPADTFVATLAADVSETSGRDLVESIYSSSLPTGVYVGVGDYDEVSLDAAYRGRTENQGKGASLNLSYNITDAFQLTSITSYREIDSYRGYDADGTAVVQLLNVAQSENEAWNQEIRGLLTADRVRLTAGLNYFHEKGKFGFSSRLPTLPIVPLSPYDTTKLEAFAVFGQLEFDITDRLTAVAGLRFNDEQREFTVDYSRAPTPGFFTSGEVEDDEWIPSAGLNFKVTPDLLVYVKTSRGYQAGGFNVTPGATIPTPDTFGPEELWAYEAGLKSQFLDRRMTFNAAAFYYDYQDLQVRGTTGIGVITVDNAASATVQGIETSLSWLAVEDLTLGAHLSYTDSTYDEFCQGISGGAPQGEDPLCAPLAGQPAAADRSGNKLNQAPEWSGGLSVDYRRAIGAGTLNLHADYSYESTVYYTPTNESVLESGGWDKIGARIGYQLDNGTEFYLFGRNLGNHRYMVWNVRAGATIVQASVNEPRTYGAGLKYRF